MGPPCTGVSVPDLDAWLEGGRRVAVPSRTGEHELFVRQEGRGPWTTFLHGFPTSSWDWAAMAQHLPADRTRLYMDHLGFGASEKPVDLDYRMVDQADRVLALWRVLGVDATLLVVHDYSCTVAQELLARMLQGSYDGPELTGVLLLNGGLFYSRIRPRPIQRLLANPWTGPLVARLVTQGSFRRAMRRIASEQHAPTTFELAQQWAALTREGGRRAMPKVARYLHEREALEDRWTRALSENPVPLGFLWGLQDPVSGPTILSRVRGLLPDAHVHAWKDVGHYPQLEVPERVARVVAAWETQAPPEESRAEG